MGCFFSGNCFKRINGLKKVKKERHKQVKIASEKTKESKWRFLSSKIKTVIANGSARRGAAVHGMAMEDIAAVRIQTAFRAYTARKALRRLRGTVRFRAVIGNHSMGDQATATLSHIHFWSKIQGEIRARRASMVTEGKTMQKKLENQLKLEAKLQDLEEEWCGGSESMEEILTRIQQREDAATKRERAMAYAFSHQWRAASSQCFGQAYYDLGKESWGWSWKERWIAIRPWETRVHAKSTVPKKSQTKQGPKVGKATNRPGMKIIVSVKPNSSTSRGTTKEKKRLTSSAEKEVTKEANTETLRT